MSGRRQYDPDHCTACGDFLPCGRSYLSHDPTSVHTPGSVRRVPNKPKTPVTGFRIPESIKAAAAARAAAEDKTLTDVVVEHLTRYGKGKPKPPKS